MSAAMSMAMSAALPVTPTLASPSWWGADSTRQRTPDGVEVLEHAATRPGLKRTPILICSSMAHEALLDRFGGRLHLRILRKPAHRDEIGWALNLLMVPEAA